MAGIPCFCIAKSAKPCRRIWISCQHRQHLPQQRYSILSSMLFKQSIWGAVNHSSNYYSHLVSDVSIRSEATEVDLVPRCLLILLWVVWEVRGTRHCRSHAF